MLWQIGATHIVCHTTGVCFKPPIAIDNACFAAPNHDNANDVDDGKTCRNDRLAHITVLAPCARQLFGHQELAGVGLVSTIESRHNHRVLNMTLCALIKTSVP